MILSPGFTTASAAAAAAAAADIDINKYIIQGQIMEILLWLLLLVRSVSLLGCW